MALVKSGAIVGSIYNWWSYGTLTLATLLMAPIVWSNCMESIPFAIAAPVPKPAPTSVVAPKPR